ncbi:hypothetical protein SAMN03159341_10350 [Paenibacillus sp. 1_12]|uniref:hypothetical protein n=1 Tax=Paenibacillus sp. 1_12 TaxID=1566278 RepID=UPI0008E35593|nr:hypothetical protein [Paenibacillus sp. 1_12]SFL06862.1 hypothetical protein SAMN03159341_10350 [Paenibacillus sp. 1_12]
MLLETLFETKKQIQSLNHAHQNADIMLGQPKATFPDFRIIGIANEGKQSFSVTVWNGGMIEINITYYTLTEEGKNIIMTLLKHAGAS